MQAQEQEELSIEEKATLFQQLLEKRRKNFTAKRVEEKRNKPPTKAQQRQIMCTYLKNMEGYKLKDLKSKGFNSIQEMFDRAFKRVNTFKDFRTELVEEKEEREGEELMQENAKKQKVEDDKEKREPILLIVYPLFQELRDNTFSGLDNKDANEHTEKVLDIVDLFHIPDVTQDQIMLRVFPMSLTEAASRWQGMNQLVQLILRKVLRRNFLANTVHMPELLKMEEINNFQQELDETLYQAWERFKELLLRCPQHYLMDMQEVIFFYKGLDVPTRQIFDSKGVIPSMKATDAKKAIQDMVDHSQKWNNGTSTRTRSLGELAPTKLIIELADRTIKRPKGIAENVIVGIDKYVFLIDFIILDMPEDIKVPLILKRLFLSTAHAKIDVFKRKITLRVGDEKIVFKSDNHTSNLIRRVYVLGLREQMELDLEARLMGEALILNRSLDSMYGDYIKLNDLNEPLELTRNQVEDLGPTIEEGEVIDEPIEDIVKTRNDDNKISNKIDEYPSFCDFDGKIYINCAYNLQFSFMIGALINVPIFVGNFSVMTDFAVVENMDTYQDRDMGEVIVGKPFCGEVCAKPRRFDGTIAIYNGNDSVSTRDKLNGISHPYQKLKSFYKGVLNLRTKYIRDAKIE
ncbi:reverse transcriptase domain-containing protein [Tanacetum coccineum]